jgi:hypothetical protein
MQEQMTLKHITFFGNSNLILTFSHKTKTHFLKTLVFIGSILQSPSILDEPSQEPWRVYHSMGSFRPHGHLGILLSRGIYIIFHLQIVTIIEILIRIRIPNKWIQVCHCLTGDSRGLSELFLNINI